jgi:hypothetical protein
MIIDTLRNSLKLIDRSKIIAIHLSQEDYDEIAKESYVELDKNPKTIFGYPLVYPSTHTHIEVEI